LAKVSREQGILQTVQLYFATSLYVFKEWWQNHKEEEDSYVSWAVKQYPWFKPYAQEALAIRHNYTPKEDTLEVVDQLREQGFTTVVASNLHQHYAQSLRDKYPKLLELFDMEFFANQEHRTKSQPEYFDKLLKELEEKKGINPTSSLIIFIDDSSNNVKVAESIECDSKKLIQGILFKNAQQLTQELYERGVVLRAKKKQD